MTAAPDHQAAKARLTDVMDVQAELGVEMNAPRSIVWERVISLSDRPTLKSWSPLTGNWPSETASARVVMDKGTDMIRTETIVKMVPNERFLLKVEAPDSGILAWLDHMLCNSAQGCKLTMSVIVSVKAPDASMDRNAYIAATIDALEQTLMAYRAQVAEQL
ncbi:hypothetical protein FHR22_003525 [Sphingopyxis panaciterrae]|uniref:hypothetical protein n=1 Tax=Sphingopyxis panaciterrae TaxID=363841 RepID=UPI0014224C59|nr:hypothetical protein [Sphingopyxis panaciterrae]NIJ38801.1 hypothetical protein [Sphingopyxis panaciterrae]